MENKTLLHRSETTTSKTWQRGCRWIKMCFCCLYGACMHIFLQTANWAWVSLTQKAIFGLWKSNTFIYLFIFPTFARHANASTRSQWLCKTNSNGWQTHYPSLSAPNAVWQIIMQIKLHELSHRYPETRPKQVLVQSISFLEFLFAPDIFSIWRFFLFTSSMRRL